MKILWVFNHPAPYKVAFFNELGKNTDLTVIFERKRESDRNPSFYDVKPETFKAKILKPIKFGAHNNLTFGVRRALRKARDSIIVMNGYSSFSEMIGLNYLKARRIPYVFAINGGIVKERESHLRKRIKTHFIKGAVGYLAPDERSADYLVHYGAKRESITLYPYSTVHESEIKEKPLSDEERSALKKEFGLPDKEIYVSVGQFIDRKNSLSLIEAWGDAPKDKVLVLVGGGSEKSKYDEYVKEHNLDNVIIKDFMKHEDILKLFSLAEASVFYTKEDIYGHVTNESLSQGAPVIASENANSSVALIKDGENGFVIPIEKPALMKALSEPITEKMRRNAIETARDNTIEKMAQAHLSYFEGYLTK
jgi:glycosyltransferase involved in cell wall biosynthesis